MINLFLWILNQLKAIIQIKSKKKIFKLKNKKIQNTFKKQKK